MDATLTQIGNSVGVSIPRSLREKYGFKKGKKVTFEEVESGLVIKSVPKKGQQKKTAVSSEFKKWLKEALREDAEILDELANR